MADDFKGSSSHAAQHQHGVVPRSEPAAPQTVEQRVGKLEIKDYGVERLEERVAALEKRVEELLASRKTE